MRFSNLTSARSKTPTSQGCHQVSPSFQEGSLVTNICPTSNNRRVNTPHQRRPVPQARAWVKLIENRWAWISQASKILTLRITGCSLQKRLSICYLSSSRVLENLSQRIRISLECQFCRIGPLRASMGASGKDLRHPKDLSRGTRQCWAERS